MIEKLAVHPIKQLESSLEKEVNQNLAQTILILSYGMSSQRALVKEFYGRDFQKSWNKLIKFYRNLPKFDYVRVDLIVEETDITYTKLVEQLLMIKRNNYVPFGIRFKGVKRRLFLKEELTANAIVIPDKNHKLGKNHPNLHFNLPNYRNYMRKKYGDQELNLNYIETADVTIFKTEAFLLEGSDILRLKNDDYGNQFRVVDEENFPEMLDLVIQRGGEYLLNQLESNGAFIYGYFPCYDKIIPNYNAIRHFSSIYALLETGELLENDEMIQRSLQGLVWGFENLGVEKNGLYLIQEEINGVVEYKLGAQALAILASAKYTQITGDTQFFAKMKTLTKTIESLFLTADDETIHVFDGNLAIKNKFRIIYYDGEALFAMLRAYGLLKDEAIFALCRRLMEHFVANGYEKYHDHWLSYAVNEFLIYEEKDTYYHFGLKNALSKIEFMKKRDTAYPTMLELLAAAAKMIAKLERYHRREKILSDEGFLAAKDKIYEVMNYRAYHELVTGTMFPELAMYFKKPEKIEFGFFARHDRFRMRIDDAEHFLSGLINYRQLTK